MTPFTTLTSVVVPLIRDNIDTDIIIPSREMTSTGKTGLKDGLFAPWRYTNAVTRTPNPDFAMNRPEFTGARILASGANFGCGSSREHAVWALAEYGVACVVAESFAPIFYTNCIRNGIAPITLPVGTRHCRLLRLDSSDANGILRKKNFSCLLHNIVSQKPYALEKDLYLQKEVACDRPN